MKYLLTITFLVVVLIPRAQQEAVSVFNGKRVTIDSSGNYSFIVSGHFYGDGTNLSGYPANTLLANLDMMNTSGANMLICLGDLFKDVANDRTKYEMALFRKLELPLFNSVGNHDLTGTVYQDHFGATWFRFRVGNDIHVILDTEESNGDIKGAQLDMLREVEDETKSGEINNVFVYGHRTVFAGAYDELDGLFRDNTQSLSATNFKDEVLPIASRLASRSNLYWFAGSLGGLAPASFFYFPDDRNNITYIGTAIRALPRDAVLFVHVAGGKVSFEPWSLTGQPVENLEHYDTGFWQSTSGEPPFNYRLIPYYIQLTVLHRYFWYGIAFAFSLVLAVRLLRRRKKQGQA